MSESFSKCLDVLLAFPYTATLSSGRPISISCKLDFRVARNDRDSDAGRRMLRRKEWMKDVVKSLVWLCDMRKINVKNGIS